MLLRLDGPNRFVSDERHLSDTKCSPSTFAKVALYHAEKAKSPITVKLGDTQIVVSPNQHYYWLRFSVAQAIKPFRISRTVVQKQ